ncbi:DNA-binding protein Fis [hydrothermal vent metagenome]|uniref:Putative Fis-like DNA-binding protein n=1 Tax=hydrothermal vent metagenome TaxID=652676 RepID=A0A3B0XXN5_9ZZZZ
MNTSNVINLPDIRIKEAPDTELNTAIRSSLIQFLNDLDGENPGNIYDLVIQQVEAPLLELILRHAEGNQSKAAAYLGINRGTLRKKLKTHQLIE